MPAPAADPPADRAGTTNSLASRPGPAGLQAPPDRVVVVLSSSRGGSSLLFHVLRATSAFLSLRGEHTPLYRLHGLGLPTAPDAHDGTIAPDADVPGFAGRVMQEVSVADAAEPVDARAYTADLVRHLTWQWPALRSSRTRLATQVRLAVERRAGRAAFDAEAVLLDLVARLRADGFDLNPFYYDLADDRIRQAFPTLGRPEGPPPAGFLEEPPFLVPRPVRRQPDGADGSRPLLLKASVDAYRLDVLAAAFPRSDLRVVHLVRNPAASINGLMDGWEDRGFFSHELSDRVALDIAGYSHHPWGRAWWNFDLPPGWRTVAERPLAEVCAYQWTGAHDSILTALEKHALPTLRVNAEDVMAAGARRRAAVAAVLRFAGCRTEHAARVPDQVGPVAATVAPRLGRWKQRGELLAPVLGRRDVAETTERLGYGREPDDRWT